MSQDAPFDRRLRRLRRDRAARAGSDADYLHRLATDELIERLDGVKRDFRKALDLGCGGGYAARRLRDRGLEVVSCDPGHEFARSAAGVQCDEDRLPFADGSFDLIMSVGALDTVNDLPGALLLIRRALKPDGLFVGAIAGAGSLPRLKQAMLAADSVQGGVSPRIHPQIDLRAAGDLLARGGFALPVADSDRVVVRYPHLLRLVHDLRGMAATNVLAERSRHAITKAGLEAAMGEFAMAADEDAKTAEAFEIIYLLGWGPAPDQPRPARRGSATASLAAALRPRQG
jgi:SAM-dependent methyltransferase